MEDFTEKTYNDYVKFLVETLHNDVSINSYLRDMITTMHYLMREGYVAPFKMRAIKVDKKPIETYRDDELIKLLKKPNMKKCSFSEYKNWIITNFLFATGVRQRSLENIKIKNIDFDNNVVYVNTTKNRNPLIIPLNQTMVKILNEYLKYRQHSNTDEYLFCNVFGQRLVKSTSYHMLYQYNKSRGVETTGSHRYRHTLAKQWIVNGGDIVSLSKLLGHSSLEITQNYINYLVSDLSKQVNELNLLDRFRPHMYTLSARLKSNALNMNKIYNRINNRIKVLNLIKVGNTYIKENILELKLEFENGYICKNKKAYEILVYCCLANHFRH